MASPSAEIDLRDRRVLVVEDEFFIADEIAAALKDCHAFVVGPAPSVAEARRRCEQDAPDCVVLDINLRGQMVFEFASELMARGVRLVFATGYDAAAIPERFADVPRFEKPLDVGQLLEAVARACGRA